jgi:beta-lactamase regulating signal transducer with metallopeptidase domain
MPIGSKGHAQRPAHGAEAKHRRALLVSMGALIVLGTSPVFGHHVPVGADELLAGREHLLSVCLTSLHLLFEPIHAVSHWLLIGGVAYALWDRFHSWHSIRKALAQLPTTAAADDAHVARAAGKAGLHLARVRIASGLPDPAFTTGLWQTVVYLDRTAIELLTEEQLEMVLRHERSHCDRRDPLRLTILRFLANTVFYLPVFRRLADETQDEYEIIADDEAVFRAQSTSSATTLASALVVIARRWSSPSLVAVTGILSRDLLERRVRRLLGESVEGRSSVTTGAIAGAVATLAVVWAAGVMMAHPLQPSHCEHHSTMALTHLLCPGKHALHAGPKCPHESTTTEPVHTA